MSGLWWVPDPTSTLDEQIRQVEADLMFVKGEISGLVIAQGLSRGRTQKRITRALSESVQSRDEMGRWLRMARETETKRGTE